ncbi:peroxidasin homolog [Mercenaria mercenaria]|uniref:peroxidasin homolog n=1 Tax=Mercenaria mercenaria TaxID=6596 RepID=UPI00234EB673|nr:peroxidasin homolog [Mercenaria mercenaria]
MPSVRLGFIVLFLTLVAGNSGVLHISFNGKDISDLQEGEPIRVIEGHDLLFDCSSSYANSSFVWTKNDSLSSFNQRKNITQVQVTDGGIYNCQATSFDERNDYEIVENKSISVKILYPPSYPMAGLVFIDRPYYALHGEIITLSCKSEANPEPNYQWRRGDVTGPLLSRNANYRLTVESYIVDYHCIVNNQMVPTVGEAITTSITNKLQIRVNVKAYILQTEDGIYRTVNEGDSITVKCNAYGKPPPKIWWTKAGDNNFYMESDHLTERSVRRHFAGDYFCNAENSVTASNRSRITTHSKQKVHITVNENNIGNDSSDANCLNQDSLETMVEEEDSKNVALFILAALGWLGFASSMLIHIIICTKNRNKRRDIANKARSISTSKSNETLSSTSSFHNSGISGSYSDLTKYDEMKPRSFSLVSSTNSESSNMTSLSTVSSCNAFLPNN